jgi:hypothetical protein
MGLRRFIWISAVLAAVCWPDWAQAQTMYRPSSPTISPWFGLYQRNSGPLDPYHSIVRPQLQLRNTLRQQSADIQYNNQQINSVGQEVTQMQEQGPLPMTGTGSVFMDTAHYFPSGTYGSSGYGYSAYGGNARRGLADWREQSHLGTYHPAISTIHRAPNAGNFIGH